MTAGPDIRNPGHGARRIKYRSATFAEDRQAAPLDGKPNSCLGFALMLTLGIPPETFLEIQGIRQDARCQGKPAITFWETCLLLGELGGREEFQGMERPRNPSGHGEVGNGPARRGAFQAGQALPACIRRGPAGLRHACHGHAGEPASCGLDHAPRTAGSRPGFGVGIRSTAPLTGRAGANLRPAGATL